MSVQIFTDGSCLGNPGPGGWAALVLRGDQKRFIKGGEADTTNNRMEMIAAIRALETMETGIHIRVVTDSKYVRDGVTQWLPTWKRMNWRRKDGMIKNLDLWRELDRHNDRLNIEWEWVRAHAGHEFNELVDSIARTEAEAVQSASMQGHESGR